MAGESSGGEWTDAARWQGFLRRRYPGVAVSVDAATQPFRARYRSWYLGDIEFAEIHSTVAQDMSVARPSVQAPDAWYLPLQLRGGFRVGQCEHEFRADAGSMVILDSHRPHWRSLEPGSRLLNVRIPKRRLGTHVADPHTGLAVPIPAGSGYALVLRNFIVSLWQRRNEIGGRQGAGLADALVQLVAGLAADHEATGARIEVAMRRNEVRRQRLLEFVETHIDDPGLDVTFAAAACGMSARYLHTLMSATGSTFSQLVRERRLQRARFALEQDFGSRRAICAIALDCGFTDMSHFSSVFRGRYGTSPSEWRRLHAGQPVRSQGQAAPDRSSPSS